MHKKVDSTIQDTQDTQKNEVQESSSDQARGSVHWRNGFIVVGVAGFLWLLVLLAPILSPFLVGMGLAYLGDPLADRLEDRGCSRILSVIIVFSLISFVLFVALLILIPILSHQLQLLVDRLPGFFVWMQGVAIPWLTDKAGYDFALWDVDRVKETALSSWQEWGGVAALFGKHFATSSIAVLAFFANMALIPVVAFYLLKDWDIMLHELRGLLPRRFEPTIVSLGKECDEVISAFVRGQLLVMMALGFAYSFGLWAIGIELAFLIGMVSGLASIVPYLGFSVGIVAALIAAVVQFQDVLHPVLVIMVFSIGQMLEGMVLTPLLVGDRIGLHPVVVIFAVLSGAQLFGFVGMLLALPVAAVVWVMLRHCHRRYLQSSLYHQGF